MNTVVMPGRHSEKQGAEEMMKVDFEINFSVTILDVSFEWKWYCKKVLATNSFTIKFFKTVAVTSKNIWLCERLFLVLPTVFSTIKKSWSSESSFKNNGFNLKKVLSRLCDNPIISLLDLNRIENSYLAKLWMQNKQWF